MIDPCERLLTSSQLGALLGLSRAAIYVEMKQRGLPRPIRIGSRSSRWKLSEILSWIESREKVLPDVGAPR